MNQSTTNIDSHPVRATVPRFPGFESGTVKVAGGARRWVTVVGLAILAALGSRGAIAQDEVVPDADMNLSRPELRWCLFERIRIEGESDKLNQYEQWEVDRFNGTVHALNEHCQNRRYRERDHRTITAELTPGKRRALEQAGAARLISARADREGRRVYVKDRAAVVRTAPGEAAAELRRVPRWGELIATGRTRGRWYEVEWNEPSLDTALRFGWVLGGLLERGSGRKARFEYCETHAGRRAQHNEVVRGRTENTGARTLSVQNGTGKDAYIKLVDERGKASITFLAAEGRAAKVTGIPRGSYKLVFATGTRFSRGCDSFSEPASASRFAQRLTFGSDGAGWEVTLHSVTDGNAQRLGMNYDDFDRL
ncbi:MAG: hypothetical protein OXC01_15645 [Immundisolibacterales bacterium]|nr:hypothetical protein [Immundisolibacterales bacterium]